uniref:Centrosomal protein 57kDa n=1 Tax=Neogobius melanostomus TaxID=47308 RepID=A0A8C6TSX5_9GOBI
MDPPAEATTADALGDKDRRPQKSSKGLGCESLSLPSYKDYPAHQPFITTLVHHSAPAQTYRASSPTKAFPETNSAAILSALRNLQEKIRKLEKEKAHKRIDIPDTMKEVTESSMQSERITRTLDNAPDIRGAVGDTANCNQVLISHLAAAESRCLKLERQLDHMKKMLHSTKTDKSNIVTLVKETTRPADQHTDSPTVLARLEKLDHLEQEYLRLTCTQNNTERKIHELELKLQEEEHQRKLVEDKANQLQAGLETNRILLRSVSPRQSTRQPKEKRCNSKVKKPSLQHSPTEPHYKLSLRDVPFVAGTSVGSSHSVRANVQSVLSLLKCHQPHLCNSRVLSNKPNSSGTESQSYSSSSSLSNEDELTDLLHTLQEELRLMSLEQDELLRQVETSVSDRERKDLQREQERLLLKMERKGEQIDKLYKHKAHFKHLLKDSQAGCAKRSHVATTRKVSSRGRSAAAVKLGPGERSRRNLHLLKDMRALQMSLQT